MFDFRILMLFASDLPVSQLCLSFFRLDLSTTSLSCPLSVLLSVTDFTPPELVVSLSLLCASFVVSAERCRFLVLSKSVMCRFRSFALSRAFVCCHMSLSVPMTSLFQLNVCSPFSLLCGFCAAGRPYPSEYIYPVYIYTRCIHICPYV